LTCRVFMETVNLNGLKENPMDTLSKRVKLSILLIILAALTVVCASSGGGGGQDITSDFDGPLSASIVETSGTVQVLKAVEGVFNDAVLGQELENNDQVLTHEDGRARIDLSTGTIIRLSPLSNFTLETMENTDDGILTRLQLEVGRLWVILNGGEVEVDTPSGLASVRGSYLHVWVRPEEDTTLVTCLEGECSLGNEYGTVTLVAGQTAAITGVNLPPSAGKMTDEDVDDWLQENPEATLVLIELTATVAANQGTKPSATPLVINTKTPTLPGTDAACGPPADWVLYTVQSGDTLDSLATAYQISVADLKVANCRGDSTAIFAGESLFVPNTPTITPKPTKTPLPTATNTPVPAVPTNTPVPTNSPAVMTSPVGPVPDGGSITDPALCAALYSVNVVDADGIAEVKMIYSLDGSVPDYSSAVGAGNYKLLSDAGGGTYKATYSIPSYEALAGVVKYRFVVKDSTGAFTYLPAAGAYTFTDTINCGAPTSFSGVVGPDGKFVPSTTTCANLYQVTVNDLNGISLVEISYKVKDDVGTVLGTGTLPLAYSGADLTLQNGTWDGTLSIPTTSYTANVPLTIIYQFKAKDMHGNWTTFATVFSFVDEAASCP
jgi:LysM repeat protein